MAKKQRKKTSKRRRSTVAHEELAPGTTLTATLKGKVFSALVIAGEGGKPEVEFNGQSYASPSAAGKAAAGYAVKAKGGQILVSDMVKGLLGRAKDVEPPTSCPSISYDGVVVM